MVISYNWLREYIQGKLPGPQKTAEELTMKSFEVEDIEKKNRDYIFHIDVLPNRASDCLSHIGVAREVAAIFGLKLKLPKITPIKSAIKNNFNVVVENPAKCKKYCYAIIEGVRVAKSPKWLSEKLEKCGINSINNIVDALNYIMLETGQPLHAFDVDKLASQDIFVREIKNPQNFTTLDYKKLLLPKGTLVISDAEDILAIAGIKGGKKAEISENTKNIFIESANFDPVTIYKTSKSLGLQTDASLRFKHNIHWRFAEIGIESAIAILVELAGGKVSNIKKIGAAQNKRRSIKIKGEYIRQRIGENIPDKKIISILRSLEFKVSLIGKTLIIDLPFFRQDISIEDDIVEEVARIYGFENISNINPCVEVKEIIPTKEEKLLRRVNDFMVRAGFYQVKSYSFIGEKEAERFAIKKENLAVLENPMSDNIKYLRDRLVYGLYNIFKENNNHLKFFERQAKSIKIFELDNVYYKSGKLLQEGKSFAGVFYEKDISFNEMWRNFQKFFFSLVFDCFGCKPEDIEFKKYTTEWMSGAEIYCKGKKLGYVGLIFGQAFAFEINFKEVMDGGDFEAKNVSLNKYPYASRDICFIAKEGEFSYEIVKTLKSISPIIKNVFVNDIFYGKENNKNVTLTFVFGSEKETLKDEVLDKEQERIISFAENRGWKIKK